MKAEFQAFKHNIWNKLVGVLRPNLVKYGSFAPEISGTPDTHRPNQELVKLSNCPTCGTMITSQAKRNLQFTHNADTCRLVNLVLTELGVSFEQSVSVSIYETPGPLKGFYSPAEPYTIHVSDEAYSRFPEYVIFHEAKHMVDCVTKGWSEEETPDPFARALCAKFGFKCPPPHPHPPQNMGQQFGNPFPFPQNPFHN
jgi:hypothetical protein